MTELRKKIRKLTLFAHHYSFSLLQIRRSPNLNLFIDLERIESSSPTLGVITELTQIPSTRDYKFI